MTTIEKQFITSILDKEKITMYEVGQLVEFLGKAFGTAEGPGRFTEVSKQLEEDIDNALRSAQGLGKKLLEVYNQTQNSLSAAYEGTEKKADDVYQQYKKVVEKYQNNIGHLQTIQFPEVRLPYNWKEVLEMTEKLSQMSQEQRDVFYEVVDRYSVKTDKQ
jgi:hypothetical protein